MASSQSKTSGVEAILAVQRPKLVGQDAAPMINCTASVGRKSNGIAMELTPRIRPREEKRTRPMAPSRFRPHFLESEFSASISRLIKTTNDGINAAVNLQRIRAGVL